MALGLQPELIIRNGTIVTTEGTTGGNIRVRDGVIAEIGVGLTATGGAREIDAGGWLVLPGGIDPHVHLGGNWVDDYTSGSAVGSPPSRTSSRSAVIGVPT